MSDETRAPEHEILASECLKIAQENGLESLALMVKALKREEQVVDGKPFVVDLTEETRTQRLVLINNLLRSPTEENRNALLEGVESWTGSDNPPTSTFRTALGPREKTLYGAGFTDAHAYYVDYQ